jgi:phytoene dehydrogenase-like protein
MNNPERQDNILIIGAGFAGLAAGIYARMNGYKADIFEMHDQPGEEAGKAVIQILDKRFPGLKGQTEMIDVATPVTFERYTGNWKGSFEGWLITPGNSGVLMKPMKQTLPGLKNFYMCGQWVEPGGGLPTSVMSARRLIRAICREDNRKFKAQTE